MIIWYQGSIHDKSKWMIHLNKLNCLHCICIKKIGECINVLSSLNLKCMFTLHLFQLSDMLKELATENYHYCSCFILQAAAGTCQDQQGYSSLRVTLMVILTDVVAHGLLQCPLVARWPWHLTSLNCKSRDMVLTVATLL